VLAGAERYGTPLLPALDRLALDARLDRRRRAEEAARRVPVKLLFPLVLCVLPAFGLLTVDVKNDYVQTWVRGERDLDPVEAECMSGWRGMVGRLVGSRS